MDEKDIRKIFYRDGYRLAGQFLEEGKDAAKLKAAITALYEAIDGLLDAFLQRSAGEGRAAACRKGCAWCCHQAVFATTHEFLYLGEHVHGSFSQARQDEFLRRASEKTGKTLNKEHAELLLIREACPFLEKGACAVYEARPMACRIYLSSSEESCRMEYEDPADKERIPRLYEFPLLAGRMLNEGFVAYLKQQGMVSTELPLEQGYAAMKSQGQGFEGWIG
jgi:Fe-S-cluster containining protein